MGRRMKTGERGAKEYALVCRSVSSVDSKRHLAHRVRATAQGRGVFLLSKEKQRKRAGDTRGEEGEIAAVFGGDIKG